LKVIEPQWMEIRNLSIAKKEIDINKT